MLLLVRVSVTDLMRRRRGIRRSYAPRWWFDETV